MILPSPLRILKIDAHILLLLADVYHAGLLSVFMNHLVTRVLVLGGRGAAKVVKENILYAPGRRLDIFRPEVDSEERVPVVVYIGGGNWTHWAKHKGSDVGLRLRRLGYCVVVPDLRQWPKAKTPEMVEDLRMALQWVGETVQEYGGDPGRIHLMVSLGWRRWRSG